MGNPARELAAIESVSARASALTRWVAALVVAPSVILCFAAYFVLREISFEVIHANIPYVTLGVAVVATLGPGMGIARWLCRVAVRSRRPAWIEQAAAEHSVSRASIEEAFGDWN